MTIAFWCVLIAAFLPYVWTMAAKSSTQGQGFDNNSPRVFLSKLEGWGARANWAQSNSFEAFPAFAAAVIIASMVGNIEAGMLDNLAMLFIASRVAYGICYLLNLATLRSLVWFVGMASWVSMLVMSA